MKYSIVFNQIKFPNSGGRIAALVVALLSPGLAMANAPIKDAMSNPLAQILVAIAFLLLLCIALLGYVLNGAAQVYFQKSKERKGSGGTMQAITALLVFSTLSLSANAQDAAATSAVETINGLSYAAFYLLVGVIVFEILVIMALVLLLRYFTGLSKAPVAKAAPDVAAATAKPKVSWWWKINKAVSLEREKEIDLSHDYDGISELDNSVPPWWIFAFAMTILFGIVYLYRYHVAESAPLQLEELEIAMKKGEEQRKAYLALTASNVDENTIELMDAAAIAAGKSVYDANCVACHGTQGEGNAVGPNLTDEYWLHGGDIKDIFKSVKYGWPEKGMQSWKELLSPVKMAQVTNYIVSLKGTNPPNAKEPQGELYSAAVSAATTDTTAAQ